MEKTADKCHGLQVFEHLFVAGMNVFVLAFVQTGTRFIDCNKTGKIIMFLRRVGLQRNRSAEWPTEGCARSISLGKVLF